MRERRAENDSKGFGLSHRKDRVVVYELGKTMWGVGGEGIKFWTCEVRDVYWTPKWRG